MSGEIQLRYLINTGGHTIGISDSLNVRVYYTDTSQSFYLPDNLGLVGEINIITMAQPLFFFFSSSRIVGNSSSRFDVLLHVVVQARWLAAISGRCAFPRSIMICVGGSWCYRCVDLDRDAGWNAASGQSWAFVGG